MALLCVSAFAALEFQELLANLKALTIDGRLKSLLESTLGWKKKLETETRISLCTPTINGRRTTLLNLKYQMLKKKINIYKFIIIDIQLLLKKMINKILEV